ncbi:MAG TPA: glutaminyl-peptide cyclotransferase, partial [Allosphingosinicella sp.]
MRGLLVLLFTIFASAAGAEVPVQRYELVRTYPHDPAAYTQGLFFRDGILYESTGIQGRSTIRKVRLADGKVLQSASVPASEFGEGSTDWGNEIVSVTWLNGIGYRWDRRTLRRTATFRYPGEGWGLTHDGRNLILSDGTPWLRFLDPRTFAERRRVQVTADGRPVPYLNELEWVNGELLANIWQTNRIARIDPRTGVVKAWIDLTGLDRLAGMSGRDNVLNGIAWDAKANRLFVTG